MTGTLYVCDLDGTLLAPDARPSAFTVETVNGLVADGVRVAIATARSLLSSRKVTAGLELRGPAVVYGGAFIVDLASGANLVERVLPEATVDTVLDACGRLGIPPLVYSVDGHSDSVGWVAGSESPGIAWYLEDRGVDPRFHPVSHARDLPRVGTFAIVALGPEDELTAAAALVQELLTDDVVVTLQEETYLAGTYWLEIAAPGATKGVGVDTLRELTGASRIVCFGDNRNDLAMFEAADESYAVSNAAAEVQAVASGIIASNTDDGVARWLAEHATAF